MGYDKYEKRGAYHWASAAPGYRFWRFQPHVDANYLIALRQLEHALASVKGRPPAVLDLACGDGVMTHRMRERGFSVIGLDMENLPLKLGREEMAKRGTEASFVQGSALALPFSNGAFDGVVAMELIEH